jgi:hypothetical protein
MPRCERRVLLSETYADWVDMYSDQGATAVTLRALRGIPTGVWARLDEHDTTAVPVAVAVSLVGGAGIAAGLLERTYPMDLRRFVLLSAIGTFLIGAAMMRDPRRVVLRRLRIPGVMLSAGFLGMAANIPAPHEWRYDDQYLETVLIDRAMAAGFAAVGIGFALVVIASFATRRRPLALAGGAAIVAGTATFACAQIVWGVTAVTVDPAITATSLGVGLAALSFLHVVPRLRKLQIV